MPVKKTHEQFVAEMAVKHQDIEVLGNYAGGSVNIRIRCIKDGHEWYAIPANLLRGTGCPKCAGNIKKTHEQFVAEMAIKHPNIEVLGRYTTAKDCLAVRCLVHGYEWTPTPNALLLGGGCYKCSTRENNLRRTKTHEQFVKEVREVTPNIEILGEYINCNTKIKVRCKLDGYEWEPIPNNILQHSAGCPKCAGRIVRTTQQFIDDMLVINPNIEILGDYTRSDENVRCRCRIDNYEWYPIINDLLRGSGCPACSGKGYNPHETAWFYVYTFQKYLGFGITNSPTDRHNRHKLTFEKSNIDFQLLQNIRYSGKDILELESHLKKTLPIVNTGVDGFKTEAILYTDRELLYAELDKFKLIRGML